MTISNHTPLPLTLPEFLAKAADHFTAWTEDFAYYDDEEERHQRAVELENQQQLTAAALWWSDRYPAPPSQAPNPGTNSKVRIHYPPPY